VLGRRKKRQFLRNFSRKPGNDLEPTSSRSHPAGIEMATYRRADPGAWPIDDGGCPTGESVPNPNYDPELPRPEWSRPGSERICPRPLGHNTEPQRQSPDAARGHCGHADGVTEPGRRFIRIGYWQSEGQPHWPDPIAMVDQWDEGERFAVYASSSRATGSSIPRTVALAACVRSKSETRADRWCVRLARGACPLRSPSRRSPTGRLRESREGPGSRAESFVIDTGWWQSVSTATG
jgi:hypothetical protein